MRGWWFRVRALIWRRRWEEELQEEFAFHLEMETKKLIQQGMEPERAAREARIRLGGAERMRERARESRGTFTVDQFLHDLRHAVRGLVRAPGYTAIAVITLALGIGANTALFSVVDGVLLEPLPYPEPHELVFVEEVDLEGNAYDGSLENYRDYRDRTSSFEALAVAGYPRNESITGLEVPRRVRSQAVSRGFFEVAGVQPLRGRVLDPSQAVPGGVPEVVVTESFWNEAFPGRELGEVAVGVPITPSGPRATVVGIMPDDFGLLGEAELWYPLEQDPGLPNHRGSVGWRVVGRLAQGVDIAVAGEEMETVGRRIGEAYRDQTQIAGMRVRDLQEEVVGDIRSTLLILLGASALVLLVGCTNLAAMGLARGTSRSGEYAVRSALGAGRGRLIRHVYAESLVLTAVGVVAGLALARIILSTVVRLAPSGLPRLQEITLDVGLAGYAAAVALGTSVLFGLAPAVRIFGGGRASTLRSSSRGNSAGFRRGPWGRLIVGQVALALVLLVGSSLLVRTLMAISATDMGFDPEGVVTAEVVLPREYYPSGVEGAEFLDEVLAELGRQPGIASAGAVNLLPHRNRSILSPIPEIDGAEGPDDLMGYRVVSGDYFTTMGIPLLQGRLLEAGDDGVSNHVVVINTAAAETFWPGEDPLGKRIRLQGMDPYPDTITVVGVVGEARHWSRAPGTQPELFLPMGQRPLFGWLYGMTLTVRGALSEAELSGAVQRTVRSVDQRVPIRLSTVEAQLGGTWADRRFATLLLGGFALTGLILSGVGVYGVVSYSVSRRRREMGIRIALGAIPGQVSRMVRGEASRVVGIGLVLGTVGALFLVRLLQGLLFGVSPFDPWAFAVAVVLFLGVGWLAAALPSARASRSDPLSVMRTE